MARIPKDRTLTIPARVWEKLDNMYMSNHGVHITKTDIVSLLENITERWG